MYLVTSSRSPAATRAATVVRPRSGEDSVRTDIRSGPATSWLIPAASIRLLTFVLCTRITRCWSSSWATCSSLTSGDSSTAATRGSLPISGSTSLATSSDWMTSRSGSSIGSTV